MLKSSNYITHLYLKELDKEKDILESYVSDVKNRNYTSFNEEDDLVSIFSENIENLSYDDLCNLRDYTGYKYKRVNSLLRGVTVSDEIGIIHPNESIELADLSDDISKVIEDHSSLPSDITVYRGTTIEQFWHYGVRKLEDLEMLKGEILFEPAFTSTSLLKENSFFKEKSDYHDECNVEIEYLIPEESKCGIPLVGFDMSYSSNQYEYLIDKGTASKVLDVSFDEEGYAHIKALHIPKHVWNKEYTETEEITK